MTIIEQIVRELEAMSVPNQRKVLAFAKPLNAQGRKKPKDAGGTKVRTGRGSSY
jgi:hypothetical protein